MALLKTLSGTIGASMAVCLASVTLTACGGAPNTVARNAASAPASTGTSRPGKAQHVRIEPSRPSSASRGASGGTPRRLPRSPAGRPVATRARVHDAFARFTSCLRQNGAEFPHPGTGRNASARQLAERDTRPRSKAALERCKPILLALRPKPAGG